MKSREALPPENARWLGVVSDTHGDIPGTQIAVHQFARRDVDLIVHCGDIGSPEIPPLFAPWPTHYVLGNVDGYSPELQAAIDAAGHTLHDRFAAVVAGRRRIAVLHSDDSARFRQTIESRQWDLVCYGHTHQARYYFEFQTLVLNPGAIHRGLPPSVALVDLQNLTVTTIRLDS
ncbi:MAG: YfcE family phosphodiesterase [Pirellulaceae bacterium]